MNKPIRRRTVESLIKASDHLYYEIWMFLSMDDCLAQDPARERSLINAILEAFIIHFRVLCDFLYPERPKPDEVIANHFFEDPTDWPKSRPKLTRLLRQSRIRAGKEVAHLTYARQNVTPDDKLWKLPTIRKDMDEVIKAFFKAVPEDRLGPKCKGLKQQILQERQGKTPTDKNG